MHDEDTISVSLSNEDSPKLLPASGKLFAQGTFTGKTGPQQQDLNQENLAGSESGPSSEDDANHVLPAEAAPASTGTTQTAPEPVQFAKYSREVLTYDIYWMGIYAGTAILEAENKNGIFKITSRVQSAPVVSAFYKVEDHAESIVTNGLPFKLRIKLQEGTHATDKETVFDTGNRKITFINYLKGSKKEHDIPDGTFWDVLSGFYYVRSQKLLVGKTAYVNIFDSNKFFRTEVSVLRKDILKVTGMGEVSALIIKPELKSEGLFKKTGDILIWLTDDDKKVPVRVETKIPVGNVVAELRGVEIIE